MTHIPDNSEEAEKSVLGALMVDPESNRNVIEQLTEEHFKWDEHKAIIKSIRHLYEKRISIDILTVDDHLTATDRPEACDMMYLNQLCEDTQGISNRSVWSYYQILCERMQRRRVLSAAYNAIEAAQSIMDIDSVIEASQGALMAIEGDTSNDTVGMMDVVRDTLNAIDERLRRKGDLIGIPTGLSDLDKATLGYQPWLIIVAARPGMGKTVFGVQSLIACGQSGKDALGINLEMSNDQLAERALSAMSGVFYSKVRDPKKMNDDDWGQLARAGERLISLPISFMDNMVVTLARIKSVIRSWYRKASNPGLVVIDYLQLMQLSGIGNKTDQVGEITRALKMLSRELQIPIMVLSQLNRELEKRHDKRPINADLRDSGNIEQDADLILFPYRDEVYDPDTDRKGIGEIIIGKGRNIELGTIFTGAQFDRQRFVDLAPEWRPPEKPKRIYKKGDL